MSQIPITLFIEIPLTNINNLLQRYNIYVHENIDGKTTRYSNYGLYPRKFIENEIRSL